MSAPTNFITPWCGVRAIGPMSSVLNFDQQDRRKGADVAGVEALLRNIVNWRSTFTMQNPTAYGAEAFANAIRSHDVIMWAIEASSDAASSERWPGRVIRVSASDAEPHYLTDANATSVVDPKHIAKAAGRNKSIFRPMTF